VTEQESRRGGEVPTDINRQMLRDIPVVLGKVVEKVSQLIANETTNLAEC
jgi:hypothetical protein